MTKNRIYRVEARTFVLVNETRKDRAWKVARDFIQQTSRQPIDFKTTLVNVK